ncbi:MAG: DUF1989 domain-containing protein [Candidatus Rokubacteria bacterium]|nr:DUF1989 domain-containing protein [Candidatus Rokubacteria bacterium]
MRPPGSGGVFAGRRAIIARHDERAGGRQGSGTAGRRSHDANVNFFMNVPVGPDGAMAIAEGRSRPGDYVDLRAEMDALVAISNCPQLHNPASGGRPTPIRLLLYEPATLPGSPARP